MLPVDSFRTLMIRSPKSEALHPPTMSRPGRNQPCPCGSGKKFKNCHAKLRDHRSPDATWRRLRRVLEGYPTMMLGFIKGAYGPDALREAWEEFLLWPEEDRAFDPDTPHMQVFMPWFFHQWEPDPSGSSIEDVTLHDRSPTDVLLERRGRRLDPLLQRYLEACAATPFSFHEIVRCEPGVGFRTRDIFLGEEREVIERSASRTFEVGDALFGQVVTCDGATILEASGVHPIPPERKIPLIELRERMNDSAQPPTPGSLADWGVELLGAYHDIHDALVYPTIPVLQNTDGEDIAFHRLTFEISSPQRAFEALAHLASGRTAAHPVASETADEMLESAGRDDEGRLERVSFPWKVPGKNAGWESTLLGRVEIEGSRLVAEVNSAERAARFRTLVEERLGEDARYVGAEVQTVEQAMQARRAGEGWPVRAQPAPSGEPDLSEHPEVRQRLRELVEAQYESWVSESIPALGGLTPLEAVQEAAGREKVEALIRQFERNGLRMTPPLDQGVIERLRERLGLG